MSTVFTTSDVLDKKCVTAQLEYIQLLDIDFKHGRDCDFPCGNQLLEAIIRINHMRLISKNATSVKTDLGASCRQIFHRIASFDPAAHSRVLLQELLPCSNSPSLLSDNSSTDELEMGEVNRRVYKMCEYLGEVYKYAVMLYCFHMLYIDQGKSVSSALAPQTAPSLIGKGIIGIDVKRPHEWALERLLYSLHRLWEVEKQGPDWVGKYTFWPLWIAGMEINPTQDMRHEQKFVCESLQRLCYYLGNLAPLDAVSALQLVWAKRVPRNHCSWDEKLAMPGIQGLFFV